MDPTEAAALLDEIAEEGCSLFEMESEFRKRAESPGDPVVRTAVAALQYSLTESDEPRRETYGPFVPMLETGGAVIPPYTSDLDRDVLATWERLVGIVESPIVAARLHDLLWVTRSGSSPHEHARAAIDNYIAATELARCDGLEPFSFLDRAFDLSRELRVSGVAERVGRRAGEEVVSEYMRQEADPRPGVVIRLLTLLVRLPAAARPDDLHKHLDEGHVLFTGNYPDDRIALFQLQERLAGNDQAEIDRLRRASVELWIQWAEQQEKELLRQDSLNRAIEIANKTEGAADIRDDARRRIANTDPDDLHLHSIEASMKVSTEEIEKVVGPVVGRDEIGSALDRLGRWWPPTGNPAEVAAAVDKLMERFVIRQLASQVVLDDQGRPLRYLETAQEKRDREIARYEILSARTHAVFAQIVLDRIGQTYTPDHDELTTLFRTELITSDQAGVFARAMQYYWAGGFDESIHIALPRIEAVLRQRLAAAGGVTWNPPQHGTSPTRRDGGVKSLGEILRGLSECMPDEQHAMHVLLTDAVGLNLRNRYLHGLVTHNQDDQALQQDAVLVLWIAARLRLLQREPSADSPADDD